MLTLDHALDGWQCSNYIRYRVGLPIVYVVLSGLLEGNISCHEALYLDQPFQF
jgi:hypothetical protein